jgi:beta,beta-carotene 9',10'-dioxygenase
MSHFFKIIGKFLLLFGLAIAIHDLYYWYQKRTIFEQELKDHAEKVAENPMLLLYTSLNQEMVIPNLEIRGTIPAWLEGTLVRNSAAKFETSQEFVHHIFDGCAMLHAFSFKDGVVSYANKFLQTDYYKNVLKTGHFSKGFSADPCPLIFANFLSYFKDKATDMKYDNTNVSVAKMAATFVALTETPLPVEFDLTTLNTVGHISFKDTIKGQVTTPHPHDDFETEESFNYLTQFSRDSFYHIYAIPFTSKTRKLIASVPVEKPSYMHSFSMTKNYIILTEIPFKVNPLDLLIMNKPFIKNFVWQPEAGTLFTVVDRNNGNIVGRFKGDPFFTFHHVNAFEKNDTLIVDLVAYKDPSIIDDLTLENVFNGVDGSKTNPILTRCVVNMNNKSVTSKVVSDACIEMPRINYAKYAMKPYTYVYGIGVTHEGLVKINVDTGAVLEWREQDCSAGEPVFVAAPDAQTEDDGIVLSVVLDARTKSSFLLLLDAHTYTEIGRALLPHHIPFQIHGDFFKH